MANLLSTIILIICNIYICICIDYSKMVVTNAITNIPISNAHNCFNDSHGFSSFNKSGRTVTNDMCKNEPAVNGNIHDVLASIKLITHNLK